MREMRLALVTDGEVDEIVCSRLYADDKLVEWSSLTKTVTARIFEQLLQTGTVEPRTPVAELLSFARLGDCTLEDLVLHRSGLPTMHPGAGNGLISDPCQGADRENFLQHLPESVWTTARGEAGAYRYSNLGYALLGAALEVASKQQWFNLVQQKVLPPDAFPSVTFSPPSEAQSVPRLFGMRRRPWSMSAGAYLSAGGLWSTFDDLVSYADASLRSGSTMGWHVTESGALFHTGQARDTGACIVLDRERAMAGVAHAMLRKPDAAKDALFKMMVNER